MPVPSAAPTYDPPADATAGETLVWLVRADDTPPADGWACKVTLHGQAAAGQPVTVAATQEDARTYRVTVSPTQSAALGPGRVRWTAMATKGTETYRVDRGEFALASLDGRTQAVQDLAAVDTAIRALREGAVSEYTLGARTVRHIDLPELRRERNRLAQRVRTERNGTPFVSYPVTF